MFFFLDGFFSGTKNTKPGIGKLSGNPEIYNIILEYRIKIVNTYMTPTKEKEKGRLWL